MRDGSILLVAGAWLAVACWDGVVARLARLGTRVTAVPISGRDDEKLGTLDEQVECVVDAVGACVGPVMLVGHSHGGTIVTGALARVSNRGGTTVFLDAAVPISGQSTSDTWPVELRQRLAARVGRDGKLPYDTSLASLVPDMARDRSSSRSLLRAEPWAALTTRLRVGADDVGLEGRRTWFVRSSSTDSSYEADRRRASDRGWHTAGVHGGHYPMLTNPAGLADALASIVRHADTDVGTGDDW